MCDLKHKNGAAELLEKLLKDELKVRSKKSLVQSQSFAEKLKKTLNACHNRAITNDDSGLGGVDQAGQGNGRRHQTRRRPRLHG